MRKRIVAFVALLGLAMALGAGSGGRAATANLNYAGWDPLNTGTGKYIDQATASWDVSCHQSTFSTRSCARWLGTFGIPLYGQPIWQGGETSETGYNNGNTYLFIEAAGGPCESAVNAHGGTNGIIRIPDVLPMGITLGDRLLVHSYVYDASLEVYFNDTSTGSTGDLSIPCSSAWEYRGNEGSFSAERPLDNGCLDGLTQFTDNDILGPVVHLVGESGSTYHALGSLSRTQLSPMQDLGGQTLATSGALGSNSNFLLDWVQAGTHDC